MVSDALTAFPLERIDAEVLLASAVGRPRSWVLAHDKDALDEEAAARFAALACRRAAAEPVAYLLGEREFYGRMFRVSPATLIPRPATEQLVEQVLRIADGLDVERIRAIDNGIVAWTELQDDAASVRTYVDIGTGSGCIAVTLACERPDCRVIATDIDAAALEIAAENARRHGAGDRIAYRKGSGLDPVMDMREPFLLVSNPPYIPAGTVLVRDVAAFEPHAALFAGTNGTDVLHPLIRAARSHPFCRGFIVECRSEQAESLEKQ